MSAYYQLLPTRPDADGDPPPSTPVRDPPSFLYRLVASLPFSWQLYGHYRSFHNFKRPKVLWSEQPSKRHITLYAAGASAALVLILALVVYQERMKEYIMDTFFGPAPPAACLRDPSAASSYVPWRPLAADDQLVYHCIKVPHTSEPPPLRVYQSLPSTCRDSFFENGDICNQHSTSTIFDLVWTWVNGSDPLLQDAMAAAEHSVTGQENAMGHQAGQKLYRDHDELRHSLRSALAHFRPHASTFHLVTSDFPFPPHAENRRIRLGMVPQWLNPTTQGAWRDANVNLNLVHHAQLYSIYHGTPFNSFSIESQLDNLPSTDNIIYLNDDFFFMKDLHAADFHTPSFGLVFRLLSWPGLQSNPEEISTKPANGEWRPLEYTNFLLSKRFGFRKRPYPTHVAKVGALPLMQEMVRVWSDEFATTARHKFRGERGDAYMMTGFVHFVVERHREALLWTYVVGRIGGDRDEWGAEQRRRVWTELGGGSGTVGGSVVGGRTLTVQVIKRQTLAEERVKAALDATGDALGGTRYQFSSQDGYPYGFLDDRGVEVNEQLAWWPTFFNTTNFPANETLRPAWTTCTIDYDVCFEGGFDKASDVFANVAFESPMCGDCMLKALVSQSGPLGLSALLPPANRVYPRSSTPKPISENSIPPHLPLGKDWQNIDFSLRAVLGSGTWGSGISIREFSQRLLERYRYVIGDSPFYFSIIYNEVAAHQQFDQMDKNPNISLSAINDDIKEKFEEADELMRRWFEKRWPIPAAWEAT